MTGMRQAGAATPSDLGDVLAPMMPTIQIALVAIGAVSVVLGGVQVALTMMRADPARGFAPAIAGVGMMVTGLVGVPVTMSLFPTETPDPTVTPTPPVPVDFTWLWWVLGSVGAVGAAAGLVFAGTALTRRLGRSRRRATETRAARTRLTAKWAEYRDQHNTLLRKILHAETDWDALFFTPVLTDPTVPQTAAMLRAMRAANTLRDTVGDLPADLPAGTGITALPYPRAVDDFAAAWDAAEAHARRVGQSGIPAAERKTITQIRTFLDIAENSAASETERVLAYRRAQTLIEGLQSIHIPARAIEQLEHQHRLAVTVAGS